jgi:hypothetical protein
MFSWGLPTSWLVESFSIANFWIDFLPKSLCRFCYNYTFNPLPRANEVVGSCGLAASYSMLLVHVEHDFSLHNFPRHSNLWTISPSSLLLHFNFHILLRLLRFGWNLHFMFQNYPSKFLCPCICFLQLQIFFTRYTKPTFWICELL